MHLEMLTAETLAKELRAVQAERQRAQDACEQMGKRIAELDAENALLKKQVEVLGRMAERLPSVAAKCFPNPYKL